MKVCRWWLFVGDSGESNGVSEVYMCSLTLSALVQTNISRNIVRAFGTKAERSKQISQPRQQHSSFHMFVGIWKVRWAIYTFTAWVRDHAHTHAYNVRMCISGVTIRYTPTTKQMAQKLSQLQHWHLKRGIIRNVASISVHWPYTYFDSRYFVLV